MENLSPIAGWVYGSVWLLGLWHGNWETEEKGITVGANMGACIPAPRILETIERLELRAMRQQAKDKGARENSLSPQRSVAKARHEILATMLSTPPQPRTKAAKKRVKSK
jgi:hypothetical protein